MVFGRSFPDAWLRRSTPSLLGLGFDHWVPPDAHPGEDHSRAAVWFAARLSGLIMLC